MGELGIAPPFLASALDEDEWSTTRPGRFTPGEKSPRDGPQYRSGRCGAEENLLSLPGIEHQPSRLLSVAIPTELSRLQ
jgi:hypothetical protein